jgi:hypothetical protein
MSRVDFAIPDFCLLISNVPSAGRQTRTQILLFVVMKLSTKFTTEAQRHRETLENGFLCDSVPLW